MICKGNFGKFSFLAKSLTGWVIVSNLRSFKACEVCEGNKAGMVRKVLTCLHRFLVHRSLFLKLACKSICEADELTKDGIGHQCGLSLHASEVSMVASYYYF